MAARMGFLSTLPNAHKLNISEDVLRASAPSVLGKWLVADMSWRFDAGTHTDKEKIVGMVPKDQDVEFVEEEDGSLKAYVDVVISKIYARDFCKIFDEDDKERKVSVEMKAETAEDDENEVVRFDIAAVTVLGKKIRPSCPNANLEIIRFSEQDGADFFDRLKKNSLTTLQKFALERKEQMAEKKSYKIDKSKEAMSDKPWGDVDKADMRNKIMEASNRASLVKAVYMKVEDGWEDAPSEHLKYPVMELKGDTFVYNKGGLSSALGYAKKENETDVVSKVEKIYNKLGLDESDGKEDTTKMSKEIEFAAVDIGDMWGKVWGAMRAREQWDYCIEGIYEEDNKKFAVLKDRDGALYRLDFSLTEEGIEVADKVIGVQKEFIETDTILKFAEPENVEEYQTFAEPEVKMSEEEMLVRIAELENDLANRDNIIMEKDAELSDLRTFKKGIEDQQKATTVETVMAEVKEFVNEDDLKKFREEGLACNMSELDAWKNKVKAVGFEASKGKTATQKKDDGIWRFAAPMNNSKKQSNSFWK